MNNGEPRSVYHIPNITMWFRLIEPPWQEELDTVEEYPLNPLLQEIKTGTCLPSYQSYIPSAN